MAKITNLTARQILDSKGIPTVEVSLYLDDGSLLKSAYSSDLSKGLYEGVEIRDNEQNTYGGLGVKKAVENINTVISPKITGHDAGAQQEIDKLLIDLDGTGNKSKLGVNSIFPVSEAVTKAGAKSQAIPLNKYISHLSGNENGMKMPVPMFNMIEGGKHGRNSLNFLEYLIFPASSKSLSEGVEIGSAVYHSLEKILGESNRSTLNAEDGGFSPSFHTNLEALSVVKEAVNGTGYSFSFDVFLGLDAAANSFWQKDKYRLIDRPEAYEVGDLVTYYQNLVNESSIIYLEDPFADEDIDGWKKISSALSEKVMLAGDDLISTNPYRLQNAVNNKIIGGVVLKPGQIGTVTEAIAVVEMAKYLKIKVIISDRSGETEDSFIADFAVGIASDYVKFGAPSRERVAKYNRLLEIEAELASK